MAIQGMRHVKSILRSEVLSVREANVDRKAEGMAEERERDVGAMSCWSAE